MVSGGTGQDVGEADGMRVVSQLAVVAVLAVAGAGGWYAWKEYGAARAAPGSRANAPPVVVDVVAARTGAVVERIEAIGTSRAFESVVVTARQPGNVAAINFTEGQRVRAGTVLMELEGRERRADVDQARAARDEIRQQLDRARQLQRTGAAAEARVDQLEAQFRAAEARVRAVESRYDDVRIVAPFDGRVGMRQVSLGALVQPGAPVTTLDDISRIRLDFNVPEIFLGQLREGLTVSAVSAAFPGRRFTGQVTIVDTRVDPNTRSVRVSAVFPNDDETLRPGMFLNVEVGLIERPNAVLVPEESVVAEAARQFVLVVRNNRVERREVRLGQRQPGEIEILQGLQAGDTVIVRGVQRVRPGLMVSPRPFQPSS
jgi:membrane fusion protein (multidrug efflux system)